MSTGPITIFDKSALQALNVDQAALFGQFYRVNLTPLFFVETLADLEKRVREGQTPEEVVGSIARKTANLTADPNVYHQRLVVRDLLGHDTPMDGRPHVDGWRPVQTEGRQGIVFEQSAEVEALSRWQRHRFLDIERDMAREWRESLRRQTLHKMDVKEMFRNIPRPRTLMDVKRCAEVFVRQPGQAFPSALDLLRVPSSFRARIYQRWLYESAPPLAAFAPYAAYVATVQMFFRVAVSLDLISGDRPSNSADIAYLYYLPFCTVFTSSDKLYAKTVPLFLRQNQQFVPGADLKADLQRLDAYFSALPSEVLERGLVHFDPPLDGDYLTTGLWHRFLPGWRPRRRDVEISSEKEAELIREFKEASEAPAGPEVSGDDAAFIMLKRSVPVTMGKWRIIAQDVAERSADLGRRVFATYADILWRKPPDGGPNAAEMMAAHRDPAALITHAVRCVRLVEIMGLFGLMDPEEGYERPSAAEIAPWLSRFICRQTSAASPISDRWAVAVIPAVLLLAKEGLRDRAANYLRGLLFWIAQRYGKGLGLADVTATPINEVRQVIGDVVPQRDVARRPEPYLATVVLDLAAFLELDRLYSLARNEFRHVNPLTPVLTSEDLRDQYMLDGAGVSYEPNAPYADVISGDWTSAAPHLARAAAPRYLQSIQRSWDHLAVSAVLRDRHFVSAWSEWKP